MIRCTKIPYIGQPSGVVIDVFRLLVLGIDFLSQVLYIFSLNLKTNNTKKVVKFTRLCYFF